MGYRFSPTFVNNLLAKYDPRGRRLTLDNFIVSCVQECRTPFYQCCGSGIRDNILRNTAFYTPRTFYHCSSNIGAVTGPYKSRMSIQPFFMSLYLQALFFGDQKYCRGPDAAPTSAQVEVPNSQRISCLDSSLGRASACGAGGRRFAPRPWHVCLGALLEDRDDPGQVSL